MNNTERIPVCNLFLTRAVKNTVTFVVLTSRPGAPRRFSVRKSFLYAAACVAAVLLAGGVLGAWKYRENTALRKELLLLEAEKARLEAVARTVGEIRNDEVAIKNLLGLEDPGIEELP